MERTTTNIPEGELEDADLTRRMEFEQEISLADLEDNARRDETKRKADAPEKTRKAKKRKLEKLIKGVRGRGGQW